ncbi:MAG: beta-propeller fold lactonase family protein, partial [Pirellulales bacterium]
MPHILILFLYFLSANVVHAERFVWFGSYTGKAPRGQGIYVSRYDENTGDISQPELACKVKNPSFLAIHPTLAVVYAVSEIADLNGQPT